MIDEELPCCRHVHDHCHKNATRFLRRSYKRDRGQTIIIIWLCDEHFESARHELIFHEWTEVSREEAVINRILHQVHDS